VPLRVYECRSSYCTRSYSWYHGRPRYPACTALSEWRKKNSADVKRKRLYGKRHGRIRSMMQTTQSIVVARGHNLYRGIVGINLTPHSLSILSNRIVLVTLAPFVASIPLSTFLVVFIVSTVKHSSWKTWLQNDPGISSFTSSDHSK
jgi:hypothetical protein